MSGRAVALSTPRQPLQPAQQVPQKAQPLAADSMLAPQRELPSTPVYNPLHTRRRRAMPMATSAQLARPLLASALRAQQPVEPDVAEEPQGVPQVPQQAPSSSSRDKRPVSPPSQVADAAVPQLKRVTPAKAAPGSELAVGGAAVATPAAAATLGAAASATPGFAADATPRFKSLQIRKHTATLV